ncbi:MAG: hypothetical protein A3F40_04745 [Chlamydiae bacterium RIFCSPHIGHO2_12_FULL_27_8]|nr:MAG: hypothetical protein A3F40_04745 [Chlamydiae bacterium RIFCSPHIGHO2_12_FULL_27_8]
MSISVDKNINAKTPLTIHAKATLVQDKDRVTKQRNDNYNTAKAINTLIFSVGGLVAILTQYGDGPTEIFGGAFGIVCVIVAFCKGQSANIEYKNQTDRIIQLERQIAISTV